jgi:predicted aconitase with swiveling domain
MICTKADLTVATGCALANIPLIICNEKDFSLLKTGQNILVNTESSNPLTTID